MSRVLPDDQHEGLHDEDPMDDVFDQENRLWWGENVDDFDFERR